MHSLNPGGMENGVVNISNGLAGLGFQTTIACLADTGLFAERLDQRVKVVTLDKNEGFSLRTAKNLSTAIASTSPDLLHTHNLGPLIYACLARLVSRKTHSIPILHGEHAELHSADRSAKKLLIRKLLYKQAKTTHSVSKSLTAHLQELGLPCARMHSIINGVDTQKYFPPRDRGQCKTELGFPADSQIIGYVARFAPFKRHLLLLEAFETIARHHPKALLLLVGHGGPAQDDVHTAVLNHPFKDRIRLTGFQQDTSSYYRVMDVHVMPSLHEGLSNAVLESMASGVPNLLHPACGAAEVITHGLDGFVDELNSPSDLASSISRLLNASGELQATGIAARQTALDRFSLHTMISNYAELYKKTVRSP